MSFNPSETWMRLRSLLLASALGLCATAAHAAELNTCNLSGVITISESTDIICEAETLIVSPNTVIEVKGDSVLNLDVSGGKIDYSNLKVQLDDNAEVHVYALVAEGQPEFLGGYDISLSYAGMIEGSSQITQPASFGAAQLTLNGVTVALNGSTLAPTP
jgi:hypothetical protein